MLPFTNILFYFFNSTSHLFSFFILYQCFLKMIFDLLKHIFYYILVSVQCAHQTQGQWQKKYLVLFIILHIVFFYPGKIICAEKIDAVHLLFDCWPFDIWRRHANLGNKHDKLESWCVFLFYLSGPGRKSFHFSPYWISDSEFVLTARHFFD